MRFFIVAGCTETAAIDGISAAGASSDLLTHTPSADAEIVVYGEPVRAPVVPISPSGCPSPAVAIRAVRELVDFPVTVVDGGLAEPTGAPTVTLGATPGGGVRTAEPVPDAASVYESARRFGRGLPDDEIAVGESIPGGTTTALGVLRALGERGAVSSSLPTNPISDKRRVVGEGLEASGLKPGDAADDPMRAVRSMGDPVLAAAAGLASGALDGGTDVVLAGGTQLLAVAALLRHDSVETPLEVHTTSFVHADESADVGALAESLDVSLTATDPGFDAVDHPATNAYCRGEAKEGVAMGGALAVADRSGQLDFVAQRFTELTDRLLDERPGGPGATEVDR